MKKGVSISDKNSKESDINLVLTSYEDIFSDFDPRAYNQKALSDDFLLECQRSLVNKDYSSRKLILSIPGDKRISKYEEQIKKRLQEHFKKHFEKNNKERIDTRARGLKWIITGSAVVILAIIIKTFRDSAFIDSIVEPFLVIPGWFTIWEGMNKLLVPKKESEMDYAFYKKMANCSINFRGY